MEQVSPPPPPFGQLKSVWYGAALLGPPNKAMWWLLDDIETTGERAHVYLFNPEWDGRWQGHGYWRFCGDSSNPDHASPFCATPEELWPHYVAWKLTGKFR